MSQMSSHNSKALSGLPTPFLEAMEKLFQILDKNGTGFIHINDIANRWQPQGDDGGDLLSQGNLPRNVVENLKKVVNSENKLTFERFCAGLKIAILRHEAEKKRNQANVNKPSDNGEPTVMDNEDQRFNLGRTNSMPNLHPTSDLTLPNNNHSHLQARLGSNLIIAPSPAPSEPIFSSGDNNDHLGPPKPPRIAGPSPWPNFNGGNDDRNVPTVGPGLLETRSRPLRRRESHQRRHTLQGGIDVSTMKKMQHWREEKAVLEEGLAFISKCQTLYTNRLRQVEECLKFGGENAVNKNFMHSEAMQERLMFELRSIRDMNQRLGCIAQSGKPGGFPSHMNLQIPPENESFQMQQRQIERLKEQNRMLTYEVGRKSNFITNLQQEKSVLIRQLFQARSSTPGTARPPPPPPPNNFPEQESFM